MSLWNGLAKKGRLEIETCISCSLSEERETQEL